MTEVHEFSPTVNIMKIPANSAMECSRFDIEDNLQSYREVVGGGYIEIVHHLAFRDLDCGCKVVMVVDEEGLLKRLPHNDRASMVAGRPIVGDVFLVAEGMVKNIDGDRDIDFVSLPEDFTPTGV